MKYLVKSQLREIVAEFKEQVLKNLETIRENEKLIRDILLHPVSGERSIKLDYWFNINRSLMEENRLALNRQLSILKFLNSPENKNKEIVVENLPAEIRTLLNIIKPINREQYIEFAIDQSIPYNESHPYFTDNDFAEELIALYAAREDYESCAQIQKRLNLNGKYSFSLN